MKAFLACALLLLVGLAVAQEKKAPVYYFNPDWSPDGSEIAFEGSRARRVADGSIVTDPNISPDGKRFVYTKEVGGKWGLYLYELGSGRERLLVGG